LPFEDEMSASTSSATDAFDIFVLPDVSELEKKRKRFVLVGSDAPVNVTNARYIKAARMRLR
jgi:hypothetical protein